MFTIYTSEAIICINFHSRLKSGWLNV